MEFVISVPLKCHLMEGILRSLNATQTNRTVEPTRTVALGVVTTMAKLDVSILCSNNGLTIINMYII